MTRTHRGQFEIMGVAILIVLVILGFTLYFLFSIGDVQEDAATTFETEQLAQTIIDTMLRTQVGPNCTESPEATLYDLVRDVTILKLGICSAPDVSRSLSLLGNATEIIVNQTTGLPWDFRVYDESDPTHPNLAMVHCVRTRRSSAERIGEQRLRMLPTTQTVIVELQFCPGGGR